MTHDQWILEVSYLIYKRTTRGFVVSKEDLVSGKKVRLSWFTAKELATEIVDLVSTETLVGDCDET